MPNKRDKNKVSVGFYMDREIRDMVKNALEKRGITLTDFLYSKLLELLNEEAKRQISKIENEKHNTKRKRVQS